MQPSNALHTLATFRHCFYECLHPRADALFELTDALLTAEGLPSPVHLSLQASHRRGWGSLYATLWRGRIDAEALRELLGRHLLAGSGSTPVYGVDVSVWNRCDAQSSPQRGYYYHPSRHSAGQPIVAGWAYQFIAQLDFVRGCWTAPVDALRVHPMEDANMVAVEQVNGLPGRLGKEESVPLFVFDAGYDPVARCSRGLRGADARSSFVCAPGVASTPIRASLAHPPTPDGRVATTRR